MCADASGDGCYKNIDIYQLFKDEVKPALGCTEVVAIGLATATAFEALNGSVPCFLKNKSNSVSRKLRFDQITKITVKLDRNVYKNAKSVAIPVSKSLVGKVLKGIEDAIILGLFCDINSLKKGNELEIFKFASVEALKKLDIVSKIPIHIKVVDKWTGKSDIYIEAKIEAVKANEKLFGKTLIRHRHSNITNISNDTGVLFRNTLKCFNHSEINKDLVLSLSLEDMITISENLPKRIKRVINKSIQVNMSLSRDGLNGKYGMNIGQSIHKLIRQKVLDNNIINQAKIQTAAACDARMGGSMKTAMSVGGAGNQGIMASIPIIVVAHNSGYDHKKLISALALSYLITIFSTHSSGELSASCGCGIKAGLGAAAGLTYYLGGKKEEIAAAINNMASTIPGMICDGAKSSCAMKLSSSTGIAIESSLLALNGIHAYEGIANYKVEKTILNIGKISNSQIFTDRILVETILAT